MATKQTRVLAKLSVAPSVTGPLPLDDRAAGHDDLLLVPATTISSIPATTASPGFSTTIISSPTRPSSRRSSIRCMLVGGVLVITRRRRHRCSPCCSTSRSSAQGIVRLMVIAPFFVMPTVSALVWKNLLMHPVSGLFAWIMQVGRPAADRLVRRRAAARRHHHRRLAMAALRHPHPAHRHPVARRGAEGSGARWTGRRRCPFFFYIVLPHLARADHRRHPDRDDLPAQRLRRDPGHRPTAGRATTTNLALPGLLRRRC